MGGKLQRSKRKTDQMKLVQKQKQKQKHKQITLSSLFQSLLQVSEALSFVERAQKTGLDLTISRENSGNGNILVQIEAKRPSLPEPVRIEEFSDSSNLSIQRFDS